MANRRGLWRDVHHPSEVRRVGRKKEACFCVEGREQAGVEGGPYPRCPPHHRGGRRAPADGRDAGATCTWRSLTATPRRRGRWTSRTLDDATSRVAMSDRTGATVSASNVRTRVDECSPSSTRVSPQGDVVTLSASPAARHLNTRAPRHNAAPYFRTAMGNVLRRVSLGDSEFEPTRTSIASASPRTPHLA